jgi:hypothetical protein
MPLQRPTTTPVPDEIFDEWLAVLGDAELRVLRYIVRRTFGFDKRSGDTISYKQFLAGITTRDGRVLDRGCGVSNRTNLSKALQKLEARGLIRRVPGRTPEGDAAVTFYVLWFAGDAVRDADDPRDRVAATARHVTRRPLLPALPPDLAVPGGTAPVLPRALAVPPRTAAALPGGALAAQPVVPPQHPQETVEHETARQEIGPFDPFDGPPHHTDVDRAILQRIIADLSRELDDAAHEAANLTRAANLWRATGVPARDFVTLLYEARRLTRLYQGKQAPGRRIEAKGAYFFAVLRQLLAARDLIHPARDPPATPITRNEQGESVPRPQEGDHD